MFKNLLIIGLTLITGLRAYITRSIRRDARTLQSATLAPRSYGSGKAQMLKRRRSLSSGSHRHAKLVSRSPLP